MMSEEKITEAPKQDEAPPQAAATPEPASKPATESTHKASAKDEQVASSKTGGSKPKKSAGTGKGAGVGSFAVMLALLVGAGAAGGGYWLWQQFEQLRSEAAATAAGQREALDLLRQQTEEAASVAADRSRQIAEMAQSADEQLRARQEALAQSFTGLRTRLGGDRRDWAGAEAEHLLRIANQRLQFAGDIQGALAALEAADQRLAAMNDPGYLPVRETLSAEMQALRNLGPSEREDAAVRLTGLIRNVATLPVSNAFRSRAPDTEAGTVKPEEAQIPLSGWRSFLTAIWQDIRGLVAVRRHDPEKMAGPLLAPEQQFFLYQNLRLELETARLALLRGQGEVYRASLEEAASWLERFFDETTAAAEFRSAVAALAQVQVERELPPIDESLRRLREVEARRDGETGP